MSFDCPMLACIANQRSLSDLHARENQNIGFMTGSDYPMQSGEAAEMLPSADFHRCA